MKTAPPTLVTFLGGNTSALQFDLWTITTPAGVVVRWTDADIDITTTDARTFVRGPVITRDRVTWVRGLQVDSLKVVMQSPSQLVNNLTLPAFATSGGFDGASVTLERCYLNTSGTYQGSLIWFTGLVAQVNPSRLGCVMEVKSQLTQLNQQLPRNLYQSGCVNDLYDPNCAAAKASFTTTGAVVGVSTDFNPYLDVSVLMDSKPGFFGGTVYLPFQLGVLKFNSGANAGISRTVQTYTRTSSLNGRLRFSRPFPFTPVVGDGFTISAGCDKTLATCQNVFNNTSHFRGFPFVPVPETVT